MNDEALPINPFKNRKSKLQTLEDINAAADEDLDQLIIDGIELLLVKYNYNTAKLLSVLPVDLKALYLTWVVEGEVNNGGFNQFYWNGYGGYAKEAYNSFLYFGAKEHADVMLEAIKIRKNERIVISLLKLIGTIAAFSYSYKISKLKIADNKFYEITESLGRLRVARIRKNPELFTLSVSNLNA